MSRSKPAKVKWDRSVLSIVAVIRISRSDTDSSVVVGGSLGDRLVVAIDEEPEVVLEYEPAWLALGTEVRPVRLKVRAVVRLPDLARRDVVVADVGHDPVDVNLRASGCASCCCNRASHDKCVQIHQLGGVAVAVVVEVYLRHGSFERLDGQGSIGIKPTEVDLT